jgi:hypothetical protein
MDYQKMWENLKYWMELAVEEGTECGYDKEENEYFKAFFAYKKVLDEMNRQEGVQNEQF